MDAARMQTAFERATTTERWSAFVGAMDEWEAELATAERGTAERPLNELQAWLCGQLLEGRRARTFALHMAAELAPTVAVNLQLLRTTEQQLSETEDRYLGDVLSAHTAAALRAESTDVPWLWRTPNREEAAVWLANVRPRYVAQFKVLTPVLPPLEDIRTFRGLLPGDCIFRRQSAGFPVNPFRDFGHAGLYIGCIDPAADPTECGNHLVVHVVSDMPACQIVSLHTFCHPGGKRESFWGVYRANLTRAERQRLVLDAVSCAGKGTYAFRSAYKDRTAMTFRCDGFVEDCHERLTPSLRPMSYRGGLFEADTWKTLNPSALRNCLTEKVAERLPPCCLP